ncbi:guanine nucleotide binding protein, alpha subunit [Mycena epipterygia]|nr:guanine nucleotide binding protein, alpha subunit [Mycena epipterygia]
MFSGEDPDPIAAALAPPPNESSEERQMRILRERAEKKVSDDIDEELLKERQQVKRQPKPVKILLLGQSESGKSTTLKNFQLMCEPKAFRAERASWRAIIQLNVIRSFRIILDAVSRASSSLDLPPSPHSSYSSHESLRPDVDLLALRARLLPLLNIEDVLVHRLGSSDTANSVYPPQPVHNPLRRMGKEVAVNAALAWKNAFLSGRESFDSAHAVDWDDPDDPGSALHARADDMQRLWSHPTVRAILQQQGIRLQESPGFFLDSLDIVTAPRYVPTDDHILRARLKTLGVSQHRMRLNDQQGGQSREFHIFDVGGQRSMRPKWVPYVEDNMDAIIFLAPISAFDQVLSEEPTINRLSDSIELWTAIISNKLLQKTNIILFLNKVDILQAKLASGIRLSDYLPAYGRRPNDYDSASRYLRKKFHAILKQSSPAPRVFYCHLTNVIVSPVAACLMSAACSFRQDMKSTTYVLAGIKDMLMRFHLKDSYLIL